MSNGQQQAADLSLILSQLEQASTNAIPSLSSLLSSQPIQFADGIASEKNLTLDYIHFLCQKIKEKPVLDAIKLLENEQVS